MTQDNPIIPLKNLQSLIYTVRGEQVMLDSDLAEIYEVETKAFNRAVKRNIERFPEHFRFQLTAEEYQQLIVDRDQSNLRRQSGTSSCEDSLRCQSGTLDDDSLRSQNATLSHGKEWFAFSKFESGAVEMLQKLGERKRSNDEG